MTPLKYFYVAALAGVILNAGCHSSTAPPVPVFEGQVLLVRTPPFWQDPMKNGGTDVFVQNTGYHAITDSNGLFVLPSLALGDNTLIISHAGWATKMFYHITNTLQNNSLTIWLYPLQPQNLAIIDSIQLIDTGIVSASLLGPLATRLIWGPWIRRPSMIPT